MARHGNTEIYPENPNIDLNTLLFGTATNDNDKSVNNRLGDLVTFIQSLSVEGGMYRIQGYYVDRKGGSNTYIAADNIIYGVGIFAPGEYIIAKAVIDNPSEIDNTEHFEVIYRG